MAKFALTVETPYGKVTRTTPRNYLYVVVAGRYNPAYVADQRERSKAACLKQIADYEAILAAGPTDPRWHSKTEYDFSEARRAAGLPSSWVGEKYPASFYEEVLGRARKSLANNDSYYDAKLGARNVEITWSQSEKGAAAGVAKLSTAGMSRFNPRTGRREQAVGPAMFVEVVCYPVVERREIKSRAK